MSNQSSPRHDRAATSGIEGELRLRRLVIVDDAGSERGVIDTADGMVQLRLATSHRTNTPFCEMLLFAGEHEPGVYSAGAELWVDGDSVAGTTVVVEGGAVRTHSF